MQKKIGQFFRKYNLIEYKAPGDSLNIDDFYKICSYAGFFKANSNEVNAIRYDEITITLISYSKPREMIKMLEKEKKISDKRRGTRNLFYTRRNVSSAVNRN